MLNELSAAVREDRGTMITLRKDFSNHCNIARHKGNKLFFSIVSDVNRIRVNMFGEIIFLAFAVIISIRSREALDVVDGICDGEEYDFILSSITFFLVGVVSPSFQIVQY